MARVYLALSKKAAGFSKLVVLKVLRSSTAKDPELRRMFFDEARIAALLNHPNVVQTYEAGDDDGRLFLAMEYLEGKSLSALSAAGPSCTLPLDVHLRIIADMLEGLHYAHGVADVDGQSKVVDVDVSKASMKTVAEANVANEKARARLNVAATQAHGLSAGAVQSMRRDWPWLVEGAPGWEAYVAPADASLPGKTETFDPN